jgi:site-specific DNA recombinase
VVITAEHQSKKELKTTNTKLTKVRLYARVSTQEQVEGVSIENQLAHLNAYATVQNWQVTGEDVDAGYSGGDDKRPALRHLLMDAKRGEFNVIAVAKLDRFFRNLRLLLNYLHEFEQLGIKFVSTGEMLDTSTPYGKFAVQIMGVIAEFERGRIGERIREGRQFRTSQGKWTSGQTPYGYKWLPKEQRWEIIEAEAKIVRYIYHLYHVEKIGTIHIHDRLNKESLRTRKGLWHFSVVLSILSNPAYKGTHRKGFLMPVIIDPDTWDKVEQQRHNARQVRGHVRLWLLQGICVCGVCGRKLGCEKKKGTQPRYYVCRGRHKEHHPDGSPTCTLPYIRAERLEFLVWNKVKQVFADPAKLQQYADKALAELEQRRAQIGECFLDIEKGIAGVKKKEERLGIAYTDGTIIESVYKVKLNQLRKQEADLIQRQHNLDPTEMIEITELGQRIKAVEELLKKGKIRLTDLGFFASDGDKYVPLGFNPWPETHGKMAIGEPAEWETVLVDDETGITMKSNLPPGFTDPGIPAAEKGQRVMTNWRELLCFLNIKVIIYPDRTEIRGAIPPQFFETSGHDNTSAKITSSVED